jgi:urea transport system ATP-binding protein
MNEELLTVEALRVCYGESEVIGRLSLSARQNEIVALMGLNGMGKTSLMKALIGLLPARAGSIRLSGRELSGSPPHERVRHGLGYVPQGRMVFPTLSVEENIKTGLGDKERRVPEHLYRFFPVLKEMRRRRAGNLSGGQQQQLAIARALASRPRVLLLDEPTEGIQPSIIKDLAVQLKQIRDQEGLTILVSEQVLSFALRVADRVLVMARGALVHESPRESLDEAKLGALLSI